MATVSASLVWLTIPLCTMQPDIDYRHANSHALLVRHTHCRIRVVGSRRGHFVLGSMTGVNV